MAARAASRTHDAPAQADRAVWPTGAAIWVVGIVSLVVAVGARLSRVMAVDSFYDLFAGRFVYAHGIPHRNDITAVAHGAPWIDQQWLAQAAYYASWLAAGYRGVAALSVLLIAAGSGMLALAMRRQGAWSSRMFAWTAIAYVVVLASYQIQAQNFGYPLFALTLLLLLADWPKARPGWRSWLVVGVLVLWANLHGSVLVGCGLTVVYGGYRAVRALVSGDRTGSGAYLALSVAGLTAAVCTPYGFGVIGYYSRFAGNPILSAHIARWGPPALGDPATWVFLTAAGAIAAAVTLAWIRGARPNPFLASSAVALLMLALMAAGNECWFAITGCLLAADAQARAGRGRAPVLSKWFTAVVAGLMAALASASLAALASTPVSHFEGQVPRRALEVAAALARQHPALRVLGDAYTSTSILWLHPITVGRVGFDARLEQYPNAELRAYFDFLFVHGPGWQRITRGFGIIVLSRRSLPLARDMARLPGWTTAYRDRCGLVLLREPRA